MTGSENSGEVLSRIYKAPGGKLLKAEMTIAQGVIGSIKITGDFFIHPEERIDNLEELLTGKEASRESVLQAVERFMEGEVEVIGARPEDFAELLFPEK